MTKRIWNILDKEIEVKTKLKYEFMYGDYIYIKYRERGKRKWNIIKEYICLISEDITNTEDLINYFKSEIQRDMKKNELYEFISK